MLQFCDEFVILDKNPFFGKTMFSKTKGKAGDDSGIGNFVTDLQFITEGMCTNKALASPRDRGRPISVEIPLPPDLKPKRKDPKDQSEKEKKPSLWTWKGLKALTNARNRRFNCSFSLLVHSIDGLPAILDDVYLVVHWRRRDGDLMTRPIRVHQGMAQFDEQLTHSCFVYGNRSGPRHTAKYESKNFLLYASVYNSPEINLGRHRVDMTRLLPLTLEELEDGRSSRNWTTIFELSGMACGAVMHVSFEYAVIGKEGDSNYSVPESPQALFDPFDLTGELSMIRRVESLPARLSEFGQSSEKVKDLHEVLPLSGFELTDSVDILYQKLEEDAYGKPVGDNLNSDHFPSDAPPAEKVCETEWEINDVSVVMKGIEAFTIEVVGPVERVSAVEKGIEEFTKEHMGLVGSVLDVDQAKENVLKTKDSCLNPLAEEMETVVQKEKKLQIMCLDSEEKVNDLCSEGLIAKNLETALVYAAGLVNDDLDSQENKATALQRKNSLDTSLLSDDLIDSVANDFLDMLGRDCSESGSGSESEPESPRERLLKQFEMDALSHGGLFDLEIKKDLLWDHRSSSKHEIFEENSNLDTCRPSVKTRASTLEDLESGAVMRDWGLSEEAFQHSPPNNSGRPVDFPHPNEVCTLPHLAEGVGPFVRTKNGGFLRSMRPGFFPNGGSLVMQVSSPVVVPVEMGSGVMDILQGLAALGIEKLSLQANRLMPLEDITGLTIHQIVREAGLCAAERFVVIVTDLFLQIFTSQSTPKDVYLRYAE